MQLESYGSDKCQICPKKHYLKHTLAAGSSNHGHIFSKCSYVLAVVFHVFQLPLNKYMLHVSYCYYIVAETLKKLIKRNFTWSVWPNLIRYIVYSCLFVCLFVSEPMTSQDSLRVNF